MIRAFLTHGYKLAQIALAWILAKDGEQVLSDVILNPFTWMVLVLKPMNRGFCSYHWNDVA